MNGNQTPKRLRHAIVLALGLGISNVALSLGLGPIDVKSYLGQPMFATIRVDGLNASTAKAMTVKLASPAAYKSRGIEMLPDHQQMRFALVPSGKGYVIRITSLGSIKEPFINFLLTISGNGNVVTREYAAFFNPDPAMEAGIGKSATVARSPAQHPAAVKKVKPQPAPASTGWGGSRHTAKSEPASQSAASSTRSTYSTPDSIPVGSSYGPIKPGETLYSIAKAARPSEAISVHDMMRMIFNANRQAFSRGNMSNLMAGATLHIPVPGKANASTNANTKAMPAMRPAASTTGKKKSERSEDNTAQAAEEASSAVSDTQNNDIDTTDVISQTPGSAAAQLVFGSDNESEAAKTSDTSEPAANENTTASASVTAEDESVTPVEESNHLALDAPESIETPQSADETTDTQNISTETELPPPVVDMPKTDDNTTIAAPVETTPPEPVVTEQPVTPAVTVQENIKSVPAPNVPKPQPVAEEKSFFSLPIPLLAGGLAGILALGGLALFFWRKRKNSDKDSVEEFSQEDIDRMVAEMEAEHEKGDLDFDALSSAIDKDNTAKAQTTEKGFSDTDTPLSENFGLTDDELPDDFFKDMELSEEEDTAKQEHGISTTPVENISLDKPETNAEPTQYSEDDFFADLEFNQSGDSPTAPSAETTDVDMDFLADLSKDLEEKDTASSESDRTTSSAQTTGKAHSTDIDFSSDSDDSFFADEPLSSDKAQENTDSTADDLDFFVEDLSSVAEKEEQTPESDSANEELDFFLDEFPEDTKEETTEKESETQEDNLDFFMGDDSPAEETNTVSTDDDATGVDFFIDEDNSQASADSDLQQDISNKANDVSVDFFSEEETEMDTPPESETSARHSDDVPNDIQNLFDDEDAALDSATTPAAEKPASKPAPVIDTEAMEINLDMATSFIAMGKNEKARSWLEEVLEVGTEEQKERAKTMLAQINKV